MRLYNFCRRWKSIVDAQIMIILEGGDKHVELVLDGEGKKQFFLACHTYLVLCLDIPCSTASPSQSLSQMAS